MEIQSETLQVPENSAQLEIPIIDLKSLLETPSNSCDEFKELREALGSWGCFQAINHGISPKFLDKVREVTKQFFNLPLEEKQKYSTENAINDLQGYGNNAVFSEKEDFIRNERLYLTIYPEDLRKLELWPEKPQALRSILDEYSTKLKQVNKDVFKVMARSLNLEENSFLEQYGEGARVSAKFSLYPKCECPDLILGQVPHADGSAITVILQDKEIEGLQFSRDDRWFIVPIVPEALLVIVGDQAEISSNGIFKSSIHRVVTNSKKERISVVAFYIPEIEREIKPFEYLIDESRPRLYGTIKNYPQIYLKYAQQGKRPIEAAKIET